MAVTVDARSNGPTPSAGTISAAWNVTIAGSNPILLVDSNQSANGGVSGNHTSGVQWDALGTPVALAPRATRDSSSGFARADIWFLLNPSLGTKQIKVTNSSSSTALQAGSASYNGVDQGTPFNAASPQSVIGTAPGVQPSLTVTSAVGEMVHDSVCDNNGIDSPFTPGGSQTQVSEGSAGAGIHTGGSSDAAGAATVTMSWSGATSDWAQVAVSLRAALPPGPGPAVAAQQRRG